MPYYCDWLRMFDIFEEYIVDYYHTCYPVQKDYLVYLIWVLMSFSVLMVFLVIYILLQIFTYGKKVKVVEERSRIMSMGQALKDDV